MLESVDLGQSIDEAAYETALVQYLPALQTLAQALQQQNLPVVVVFEGWSGAGKGRAIRLVTREIDPRAYVVHSTGPAGTTELRRPYLHRFWQRLPKAGQMALFHRSWYYRVLDERAYNLCAPSEWKRAYREINQLERQMADFGAVIVKFWFHLRRETHRQRVENRRGQDNRLDEAAAWHNHQHWDAYWAAAEEMLLRTGANEFPWTVVPAESERYARVQVLRTLTGRLAAALDVWPDGVTKPTGT